MKWSGPAEASRLHSEVNDKVRPSLESLGFDLSKTLAELFGIELRWSKDGLLPEYLVLVCGFFHDTPLAARSSAS